MRKLDFKDKVIWITGASSGIGEALAYKFNEQGAKLILSARNSNNLEKVKNNCDPSTDVFLLPMDLSKIDLIKGNVDKALSFFGKIDYLVNNAGVALHDFAINTTLDIDYKIMNVNYFAPIALTKQILPSMIKNKSGNIIVISSLSGKYGIPKLSAYSASKHALHGFFDSLRSEVYKYNINVSIIIPGIINTPITVNALLGNGIKYGKMEKYINEVYHLMNVPKELLKQFQKKRKKH